MNYRTVWMLPLGILVAFAGDDALAQPVNRHPTKVTENGVMHFPPPLDADFEHMKLELLINDMNKPEMAATEELTLHPIAYPLERLGLDAHLMNIESVEAEGYQTTYTYDGRELWVTFDPPVPVGKQITLTTTYSVTDPPYGLNWTPASDALPGRAAQIHTQGEPETNSYWFPCNDFPNDRLTTELIVTVPEGFQVLSNGRLVGKDHHIVSTKTASGTHDLQWYDTWHWAQDEEAGGGHAPYLVTLVVGKFDVVDLGTPELPIPVYVPPGRGPDVETTFGHTPEMIEFFGEQLDEPYPWAKYAQVLVWNFGAGGMENTSATSLFGDAIFNKAQSIDFDYDGLISHELGHQWFGDYLTCNSWEHIWLNEGFATFMADLWTEHRDGHDAYLANLRGAFDDVIARDNGTAPGTPAMASKVYDHPWDVFGRGANPYPKGSSILHMIRRKVGDERFFKGLATYIDEHKLTTVETSDFRKSMEEATGETFEQFFQQWVFRPGIPRLKIDTSWDSSTSSLKIHVEQTQPIDQMNPAFVFDLPLWIRVPEENGPQVYTNLLSMHTRTLDRSIELPARPDMIVFNPELDVLADLDIDQASVLWLEQLASGPTVAAKIQAARALANDDGKSAARLLYATALDKNALDMLRVEAVKALEAQGDLSRIYFLLPPGRIEQVDSPRVRVAVLDALGRMGFDHPQGSTGKSRKQITETLVDHALNDPSTKARAAAIRALGTMKAVDAADIVENAVRVESPSDEIRRTALDALTEFNMPEALPIVLQYCKPGTADRTRPVAIRDAVKLKVHDEAAVRAMLAEVLFDRNRRASQAAAEQIADIGSDWAIELLKKKQDQVRDPQDKQTLQEQIDKARGGP